MRQKTRIFINGFGRIGRAAARIVLEDASLELVGVNDLYDFGQMAYLLKYDSVYGTMKQEIYAEENSLRIDSHTVTLYREPEPGMLDLKALEIDLLLQCSGMFLTERSNQPYIDAGARRVIVSTPPDDAMPTYIYGINHAQYRGAPILSNTSCSANAIVPILTLLDRHVGVRGAQMHMFHSYTAYQKLLDSRHYSKDIRRARAAAVNIIPLQSSAAKATVQFLPHLAGNLYAKSIRIPVNATTMYDLLIKLDGVYDVDSIKALLIEEVQKQQQPVLALSREPKVSSDYIADPHSATIDLPLLDLAGGKLLRISAWQDNEYGYACRLVDMAKVVAER